MAFGPLPRQSFPYENDSRGEAIGFEMWCEVGDIQSNYRVSGIDSELSR